jgi:hypothetical protein
MIVPTVGRKVWFRPNNVAGTSLVIGHKVVQDITGEAMDATVLCTWDDGRVNLLVVDHSGEAHPVGGVKLIQEGDEVPPEGEGGYYCEWMPYQNGQAAKATAAVGPKH